MSNDIIKEIIARARDAQQRYEQEGSQERYDRAAAAAAWAIMNPERNRHLAELAVETTGLGNVPDKILKNHRKTLGLMWDIKDAVALALFQMIPQLALRRLLALKGWWGRLCHQPILPRPRPIISSTRSNAAMLLWSRRHRKASLVLRC